MSVWQRPVQCFEHGNRREHALLGLRNLPLVDHARHWLERGDYPVGWMADAIHPNRWGHLAFARLINTTLGFSDPEQFVFREILPGQPDSRS